MQSQAKTWETRGKQPVKAKGATRSPKERHPYRQGGWSNIETLSKATCQSKSAWCSVVLYNLATFQFAYKIRKPHLPLSRTHKTDINIVFRRANPTSNWAKHKRGQRHYSGMCCIRSFTDSVGLIRVCCARGYLYLQVGTVS